MSQEISVQEQQIYDRANQDHIDYQEAYQLIVDSLASEVSSDTREDIERIYRDALGKVLNRERESAKGEFDEVSKADDFERWYDSAKPTTPIWRALHERQSASVGVDNALTIHNESGKVVGLLANPKVKGIKKKGLVVGYVQSGKTANYSAVIAKAVDEGYRVIIVLAGMYNNLRQQTQVRLTRDVIEPIQKEGKSLHRLTGSTGDISPQVAGNLVDSLRTKNGVVIGVIKKNKNRLEYLYKQLENVRVEGLLENAPVLIIDDESDQATPNTAKLEEKISGINDLLRKIWDTVSHGTYVAYTATPFANILMNPNDGEELYPSDFIYALERPASYLGAERMFGIPQNFFENESGNTEDGVDVDVRRFISEEDAEILTPPTTNERKNGVEYNPHMVSSLEDAIYWFCIATGLRRMRQLDKKIHSSMLVHLTHLADMHFATGEIIKEFVVRLKKSHNLDDVNETMRSLYEREIASMRTFFPGKVYPTWESLKPHVHSAIDKTEVIIDNSKSELRLDYPDNDPKTYIVIGGNTLARGLTLEGLISSYFIRKSKTYDTLLQMGRWFGYRLGYEDLVRLWTTADIVNYYRFLAGIEEEIRLAIRSADMKPSQVGLMIRRHPDTLKITARNKMYHAQQVEVDYTGKFHQLTRFEEKNTRQLQHNLDVLNRLISVLQEDQPQESGTTCGGYLYQNVPTSVVLDYLDNFHYHESHSEFSQKSMNEWIRKYVDQDWNIVLQSSRSVQHTYNIQGLKIGMPSRSAYVDYTSKSGVADIGALASGDDPILDYKILAGASTGSDGGNSLLAKYVHEARMNRAKQLMLRVAQGNMPLLILYVVNPNSEPDKKWKGTTRRKLRAPLPVVLHAVVLPQGAGSDAKNYVSVVPELNNMDGIDDFESEDLLAALDGDDENDYKGTNSSNS